MLQTQLETPDIKQENHINVSLAKTSDVDGPNLYLCFFSMFMTSVMSTTSWQLLFGELSYIKTPILELVNLPSSRPTNPTKKSHAGREKILFMYLGSLGRTDVQKLEGLANLISPKKTGRAILVSSTHAGTQHMLQENQESYYIVDYACVSVGSISRTKHMRA